MPESWELEVQYIFSFYTHLLTDTERLAAHNILIQFKVDNSSEQMKNLLNKRLNHSKGVKEALADGRDHFYRKSYLRIVKEHDAELNRCPKCNSICRTPKACLCPKCNHSWYEQRNENTTRQLRQRAQAPSKKASNASKPASPPSAKHPYYGPIENKPSWY